MKLTVQQDSLFASTPLETVWLKHYHYDVFIPYTREQNKIDTTQHSNLRFNFKTRDDGEIGSVMVKFEPTVDPLEFKRTPLAVAVTNDELQTYEGEYELAGMTAKFYLKESGSTLYLFVAGQPEYELLPTEKDIFVIKSLEGFKVKFTKGGDGKITEVTFIQPNGTFVAKRKP
jgi:hypothetical protein